MNTTTDAGNSGPREWRPLGMAAWYRSVIAAWKPYVKLYTCSVFGTILYIHESYCRKKQQRLTTSQTPQKKLLTTLWTPFRNRKLGLCDVTSTYDHKIAQLEDKVYKLNASLDEQDTKSRSKSLVLFVAVEPTSHESSNETDLLQSVLDLCCDRLHVGLTEQDISDVRRLARKTGIRLILV